MNKLSILPANGAQYLNVKEAVEDWDSNKDFRAFPGGFMISKREIKSAKEQYDECYLKLPNLGLTLQIF